MARAGLTPEKVVLAGADLADEIGFDEVTLSRLARQFGVQVASLYSHVEGLDGLRTGVALLSLAELADRAEEAVDGRRGRDALVALGDVHRAYARQHPGRYAATRLPLPAESAARSAGPRLAQVLRVALRDHRLGEPDETHAVRLLGSLFHGFVELERGGGFDHSAPTSDESWKRILDSLDAMLAGWPR